MDAWWLSRVLGGPLVVVERLGSSAHCQGAAFQNKAMGGRHFDLAQAAARTCRAVLML
jgi:hypothetical protein